MAARGRTVPRITAPAARMLHASGLHEVGHRSERALAGSSGQRGCGSIGFVWDTPGKWPEDWLDWPDGHRQRHFKFVSRPCMTFALDRGESHAELEVDLHREASRRHRLAARACGNACSGGRCRLSTAIQRPRPPSSRWLSCQAAVRKFACTAGRPRSLSAAKETPQVAREALATSYE